MRLDHCNVGDVVSITAIIVRIDHNSGNTQVLLRAPGAGHSSTWSQLGSLECNLISKGMLPEEIQEALSAWVDEHKSQRRR